MKITYTKHAEEKFIQLERLGWKITKRKVATIVEKPHWKGVSRFGQETGLGLMDKSHILRVIYDKNDDIIKIITFHIARRGKYESTL